MELEMKKYGIVLILCLLVGCLGCVEDEQAEPAASLTSSPIPSPEATPTPSPTPTLTPTATPTPYVEPTPIATHPPLTTTIYATFTYPVVKTTIYEVKSGDSIEYKNYFTNLELAVDKLNNATITEEKGGMYSSDRASGYVGCTPGKYPIFWDMTIESGNNAIDYYKDAKKDVDAAKKILNKIYIAPPSIEYQRICYRYSSICDIYLMMLDYEISAELNFINAHQEYKVGCDTCIDRGNEYISAGNNNLESYYLRKTDYDTKVKELTELINALPVA